jgi:mRNA-degrading endonuclease RelE of RelBE toxin-antitoxin system
MPYHIRMASRSVEKQFVAVSAEDRERVIARIRALADQPRPRGVKSLARDVFRLRVGRYRVIYKVLEKERVVLIGKIALRSEQTYRGVAELF